MNYKAIVDNFKAIVLRHKIVKDFGYGELSDIKVLAQDTGGYGEADYPYAFLNPSGITVNEASRLYNFNLIMMEMVSDQTQTLQVHSNCIRYIDDLLATFNYENRGNDITLQYTISTFQERFQDEVAGATATIQMRTKEVLDYCDAPIYGNIAGQFVLDVNTILDQTFRPDIESNPIGFPEWVVDTYNGMRPVNEGANFYNIEETGTWTFVLTGTARRTTDNNTPFTTGFNMRIEDPLPYVYDEAFPSDWPTNPAVGEDFQFTMTWSDYQLSPANSFVLFNTPNEPALEDEFILLAGANLKGYYTPAV